MTKQSHSSTPACRRCKGKRQIIGEDSITYSCPDCEGSGMDMAYEDDEDDADREMLGTDADRFDGEIGNK